MICVVVSLKLDYFKLKNFYPLKTNFEIISSIFTAFVIEAFLLEYENHNKISNDSKLEQRIIELGLNANAIRAAESETYI